MKRIFSMLMLCVLMVLPLTGAASAAETPETGLHLTGTVLKDTGTYRLIDVSDHFVEEVPAVPVDSISSQDDGVMPCYNGNNGITRLTPMGVLIYPSVFYNGKKDVILDLDETMFFAEAKSFQNFIADSMSREKRLEIMDTVKALGYEQTGWYMSTGYNIDTYKPGSFTYNEWTEAGKSRTYGRSAVDGDNVFEFYSYFPDGVSNTTPFKFGITGTVTYRSGAQFPMGSMSIELSVTLK